MWGLFVLMVFIMISQGVLIYAKRNHYRFYQNATLVLLWLLPALFASYHWYWRFVGMWALFTGATTLIFLKASKKPLEKSTPRLVYNSFAYLNTLCNVCAISGWIMIVAAVMANVEGLFEVGLQFLFYGLYFGILTRDSAEMCAGMLCTIDTV